MWEQVPTPPPPTGDLQPLQLPAPAQGLLQTRPRSPAIRFNQCRLFTERHIWGWTRTPVPARLALRSQDGGGGSCWTRTWGPAHEKSLPRGLGVLGGRAGYTVPFPTAASPLLGLGGKRRGQLDLRTEPGSLQAPVAPTGLSHQGPGDRELQGSNPLQAWCLLGCGHPHRWACSATPAPQPGHPSVPSLPGELANWQLEPEAGGVPRPLRMEVWVREDGIRPRKGAQVGPIAQRREGRLGAGGPAREARLLAGGALQTPFGPW